MVNYSRISGVIELTPSINSDNRGNLIKIISDEFAPLNPIREIFYSKSYPNVIRGLHLQSSPFSITKMVACVYGEIYDVVVDLRSDSPTFGQVQTYILSAEKNNVILIPKGCAHGFANQSNKADPNESSVLLYLTDGNFSPANDTGIRYNSIGINWPISNPILSSRDLNLPTFDEYVKGLSTK